MGLKIKPTAQLLAARGLPPDGGGSVQKFVDSECVRMMEKYTPKLTGAMRDRIRSPRRKSSLYAAMTSAGSPDSGCVSMAVTKMEAGTASA